MKSLRRKETKLVVSFLICVVIAISIAINLRIYRDTLDYANAQSGQGSLTLYSTSWSTGTVQPGDLGAVLNVTLSDSGNFKLYNVYGDFNLSSESSLITNTTGGLTDSAQFPGPISPGTTSSATFSFNILEKTLQEPKFAISILMTYANSTGYTFNQTLSIPISVTLPTGVAFQYSAWSKTLEGQIGGEQGDHDTNLTLSARNGNVFQIAVNYVRISFSQNEMRSLSGGNVSASLLNYPSVLTPGENGMSIFALNIDQNATVGEIPIEVNVTYSDSLHGVFTQGSVVDIQIFGIPAISVASPVQPAEVGRTSEVAFQIENTGTAPVYSPSLSVAVPTASPIVILQNSSLSLPNTEIGAGQSIPYLVRVNLSPGTSPGSYPATLTISYYDQFGNPYKLTFSVGFVAGGTIQFFITGLSYSQTSQNVTVVGQIVNNGTVSASYATLTSNLFIKNGSSFVQQGSASEYIGQIVPTTPFSFDVVIPFKATSSQEIGNLTFVIKYQDALGNQYVSTNSRNIMLLSSSQIPQSDTRFQEIIIGSAVAGVIVAVALFSWLFFRKRRNQHYYFPNR